MKRVIMHWTAGTYKCNALDRKHYHYIVEGDGTVVTGDHPISDNSAANGPLKSGAYAAHTLGCNSDSIGISMACMLNAKEGGSWGDYPMTESQFRSMCRATADLCKMYGIKVTRQTVLSHAEVQQTLGIKQRGKWDFSILPFRRDLHGALACGDYARSLIQEIMDGDPKPVVVSTPAPVPVYTHTQVPKSPAQDIVQQITPVIPKHTSWWGVILSIFGVRR